MAEFLHFPTQVWAERESERCAIVWKRGSSAYLSNLPDKISWKLWQQLVQQAVLFLQKFSMPQGALVAYSGSSRLLGLLCYLAVLAAGGRILMLNPAQPEAVRERLLKENRVDLWLNEADFEAFLFQPNFFPDSFSVFVAQQPATFTLTSGSSGKPKAVVHSISQHLANAAGVCVAMGFSREHSWLLSLPLFHVSGQGIVWRWLLQGATLYVYEDKVDFSSTLAEVSHASLVPTQLQRYLSEQNLQPKVRLSVLLGGAPIPPDLIDKAQQCGLRSYAGYGMTEMASTVCLVEGQRESVGKPLWGREVKLVDGEIWVRGSCLAQGYWQNGQIVPLTNQQGWFETKDLGMWNEQGQLLVSGRADNRFISGGENIQPEEIEQVLFSSGLVSQVVVVPVKNAEFGARPVALIAPFSIQAVKFLQNFVMAHLERFKQPIAYFELAEKWQSEGLKISRRMLQDNVQQMMEQVEKR